MPGWPSLLRPVSSATDVTWLVLADQLVAVAFGRCEGVGHNLLDAVGEIGQFRLASAAFEGAYVERHILDRPGFVVH